MIPLILATFLPTMALIGYDCGGERFNTTILLDIDECNMENIKSKEKEVYVQLMQLSDYNRTTILQCKMEVAQTIHYCGMHSHVSVHNGRREYLQEIGEQGCQRLYEADIIRISNAVIDRIKQSTTNLKSIILAGSATVDGKCSGSQYIDGYRT